MGDMWLDCQQLSRCATRMLRQAPIAKEAVWCFGGSKSEPNNSSVCAILDARIRAG